MASGELDGDFAALIAELAASAITDSNVNLPAAPWPRLPVSARPRSGIGCVEFVSPSS